MEYEELRGMLKDPSEELQKSYKSICQRNIFIKDYGIEFRTGLVPESDCPYDVCEVYEQRTLKGFFEQGNWSARQGITYKNLLFVNQINGGSEWWTLKKFGNEWIAFESISFNAVIRNNNFEKLIKRLEDATKEQCETCMY